MITTVGLSARQALVIVALCVVVVAILLCLTPR